MCLKNKFIDFLLKCNLLLWLFIACSSHSGYKELDEKLIEELHNKYGDLNITFYDSLLKKYPYSDYLTGQMVFYLIDKSRLSSADSFLNHQFNQFPQLRDSTYSLTGMGVIFWEKNNREEALNNFNKALLADTDIKNKWLRLYLYYYYKEDEMVKAFDCLNDALSIDSNFTIARIQKSYTYNPETNCKEIINLLKNIPVTFKDEDMSSFIGDAFYNCGDIGNSIINYQKSIQINPNSFAYFGLGQIAHYVENDFEAAENYYMTSLKYDSTNFNVFVNLGWLYYEINNLNKAEFSFKKAIQLGWNCNKKLDNILSFV